MITVMLFIAFPRLLPRVYYQSNVYLCKLWKPHHKHKLFVLCQIHVHVQCTCTDSDIMIKRFFYLMNSLHKYTLLWRSKCPMPNLISSGSCILLVIHSCYYMYQHFYCLAPCIWGGCGYNSEYLWRTYGRMPPMHSLQELRTLPNELLVL